MKNLTVKATNCVIEKSETEVKINGEYINDLVLENLPQQMEKYKPYAASMNISINIEMEYVSVKTTGYKNTEGGDTNA